MVTVIAEPGSIEIRLGFDLEAEILKTGHRSEAST